MLVEIQKWGNSAALRVPAVALKEAAYPAVNAVPASAACAA